MLEITCCELNEQINVIGLNFGFVRRAIASDLAAFIALVDDDIALFRIGLYANGAKNAAAGVGAIAGVDIHVQGTEALGAVIARAITERLDFKSAVFADERIVVFGKAFLFHGKSSFSFLFYYDTPEGVFCQEKIPFQRERGFSIKIGYLWGISFSTQPSIKKMAASIYMGIVKAKKTSSVVEFGMEYMSTNIIKIQAINKHMTDVKKYLIVFIGSSLCPKK